MSDLLFDIEEDRCPVCGVRGVKMNPDSFREASFFTCPVCGRYELDNDAFGYIDEKRLAQYLFYKAFKKNKSHSELRYHTTLAKEKCDEYNIGFEHGHNIAGRPVHMDSEMINNWYPKTFAERVDRILLYLGTHTNHFGEPVRLLPQEMYALLFVDHKDEREVYEHIKWRDDKHCNYEADYMLKYLSENDYVSYSYQNDSVEIVLRPTGYTRVDDLQKDIAYGRDVLVAMKFGDETLKLRDAIRKGIEDAGYVAIFIDEVEHNNLITPEILKYIRASRFVVVDLSHRNNGAYFEEGYAMGFGKPVIQLCNKDIELHFDIAQKNTIFWSSEDDIPERLKNRIIATID